MKVLEVAMGNGGMSQRLLTANPDGTVIGVDLSPKMVAHALHRARKKSPDTKARFGAADALYLPFRTASFDAVMCCYLLELLPRDEMSQAVNEIARVLRTGANFSLVLVGQNGWAFNHLYALGQACAPAYWGRQVERGAPAIIEECGMHIIADVFVRQGFYRSRVLVARKG